MTATASHATPAAFGAHVPTRKCETEIARQYLQERHIDVTLGGGYHTFRTNWANHSNNLDYVLGALLAFEEAVGAVQAWIDAEPRRKARTLLIVLPEHSSGGFAINGPYHRLLPAGEEVTPGWTTPRP